jgi:hypothetical protein
MGYADDTTTDPIEEPDSVSIRWRAWPCESCSGGSTPLDFLVGCFEASPEVPQFGRNETIDWFKKWEADRLLDWIQSCEHTSWADLSLPRLDEGSEHLVLFDEQTSEVVKITRPCTYGDYYEIIDGRINQFDSTPAEYLLRMRWWEKLFSSAPDPIGMTEDGRILCRQKFIVGDANPPQETVDQFLIDAGVTAVNQSCWIWKKVGEETGLEVWIGDARSDNFVLSDMGIIPIDIRVWGVPVPHKSNQT